LSNHLGNVLVTVSDKKFGHVNGSSYDYYTADVANATDYYPFGMEMPNRTYSATNSYRYGFNGNENDNEVKGEGNEQDYGMRVYDTRLGRFLSVDPLRKQYPNLTPYQFSSNSPIANVDLDGGESKYYNVLLSETFNANGKLVVATKSVTEEKSIEPGWFTNGKIYQSSGPHGEGSLYTFYGSKTILKEDGTEQINISQIGAIYVSPPPKPSPNRPVSSSPINIIIFGSGVDPDEAVGDRPNPNAKIMTMNFQEFEDIMAPVLAGTPEKMSSALEPPTIDDIIKDWGEGGIDKGIDKLKEKWESEEGSNSNSTNSNLKKETDIWLAPKKVKAVSKKDTAGGSTYTWGKDSLRTDHNVKGKGNDGDTIKSIVYPKSKTNHR
jgi:RHS repeat-associated protein